MNVQWFAIKLNAPFRFYIFSFVWDLIVHTEDRYELIRILKWQKIHRITIEFDSLSCHYSCRAIIKNICRFDWQTHIFGNILQKISQCLDNLLFWELCSFSWEWPHTEGFTLIWDFGLILFILIESQSCNLPIGKILPAYWRVSFLADTNEIVTNIITEHFNGLVQDCSISSALAMEISCVSSGYKHDLSDTTSTTKT